MAIGVWRLVANWARTHKGRGAQRAAPPPPHPCLTSAGLLSALLRWSRTRRSLRRRLSSRAGRCRWVDPAVGVQYAHAGGLQRANPPFCCPPVAQVPDESEVERRLNSTLLETYRAKASGRVPASGEKASPGGKGSTSRFF